MAPLDVLRFDVNGIWSQVSQVSQVTLMWTFTLLIWLKGFENDYILIYG